jgi:hypothetical protein
MNFEDVVPNLIQKELDKIVSDLKAKVAYNKCRGLDQEEVVEEMFYRLHKLAEKHIPVAAKEQRSELSKFFDKNSAYVLSHLGLPLPEK